MEIGTGDGFWHGGNLRAEVGGIPARKGDRSPAGDRLIDESRMKCHTQVMLRKIAVTLDPNTVADLDRWVREGRYPNRSRALQSAVDYFAKSDKRNRLVRELNKLDRAEESGLAEEGLGDKSWPTY